MQTVAVTCNKCGAPLQVAHGVRFVTCQYCGSRLEVHRDATVVYTEVLDRIDQRTEQIAEDVHILRRQHELEALDRQWQIRRESLMATDKQGNKSPPSAAGALIGGVVAAVFGIFWTGSVLQMSSHAPAGFGPGPIFPLFGLLFVGFGVAMAVGGVVKAQQYRREEELYRQRREDLQRQADEPPGDPA